MLGVHFIVFHSFNFLSYVIFCYNVAVNLLYINSFEANLLGFSREPRFGFKHAHLLYTVPNHTEILHFLTSFELHLISYAPFVFFICSELRNIREL